MPRPPRRILWVDDEIDLLKPHLLFLEQRGYTVDAVPNGDDALELLRATPYDLVLLDEQMPGLRGLEVLEILRREDPHARVVMITKSEEDRTMTEAIGRRVDDYLVKPASPLQVLSAVTRILEGSSIRQQQVAQDFAARWPRLGELRHEADEAEDFAVPLQRARGLAPPPRGRRRGRAPGHGGGPPHRPAPGLRASGSATSTPEWMHDREGSPVLSPDLVSHFLVPRLDRDPILFVVLDCMRLDQWRVMLPLLTPIFDVEEVLHYSILPTATPYARNAIFSGQFPDRIAEDHPAWWAELRRRGEPERLRGRTPGSSSAGRRGAR
jgi:CheY-like chemotaxis protein